MMIRCKDITVEKKQKKAARQARIGVIIGGEMHYSNRFRVIKAPEMWLGPKHLELQSCAGDE